MRYATNGSLDNSFGSSGVIFTEVYGASDNGEAKRILMQSDGKVVLVGSAYDGTHYRPVAMQFQ